jgi:hypothetical protein
MSESQGSGFKNVPPPVFQRINSAAADGGLDKVLSRHTVERAFKDEKHVWFTKKTCADVFDITAEGGTLHKKIGDHDLKLMLDVRIVELKIRRSLMYTYANKAPGSG